MFQAEYFDGLSARSQSVWVEVKDNRLQMHVENGLLSYALNEVEVQARIGSAKRVIDLPDGARLEAIDISALEAVVPFRSARFSRMLHYLENNLAWVFVALITTVFAGWMFLQHGVPKLAEYVAKVTPPSMESRLGEQVLKGLDHRLGYFSTSKVEKGKQDKIVLALEKLCDANACPAYQLHFRDGGLIGANALALPGGMMVITDGLIELAKNDDEIIAVLAHELGHIKQRHAFRQSIQGTLSGLVLAAITGDVSSLGSGLPAALMQMRYSRQHELEADTFALAALQQSCLPPRAFAEILFRLQNQHLGLDKAKSKRKTKQKQPPVEAYNPISDMLSTHPNTLERIKPFLEAESPC